MCRRRLRHKALKLIAGGGTLLFLLTFSRAQSVSTIEVYGPVPAAQVAQSLGTNITADHEWEFQAASAAHMSWARYDCPWTNVEKQLLPQNASGGYSLPRNCASGLELARKYSIHPMLDALFGAPFSKVATAVTSRDSPAGSATISLNLTSGSLDLLQPGASYLKLGTGNLSSKHAYAGTLITAVEGNSIRLASATMVDLPAGSKVILNLQLYPPVLLQPGTSYRSNPSIQAYGRYVHYLQTQVAAAGVSGRVSIWNEPPWSGDPWDAAANLYDTPPQEQRIRQGFGVELAYYAAGLPLIPGAFLDNGYTNKTGNGSLFVPDRLNNLADIGGTRQAFASESFHPYGNNPEDGAWLPSCVSAHLSSEKLHQLLRDCTPTGMVTGANTKIQAAFNASHEGIKGLDIGITETNVCRCGNPIPTETQITRFDVRQFLVYSGSNVHPILFYRLAGNQDYEWLHSDHTPYPVFTAFQKLMADIQTIASPPIEAYQTCVVPGVDMYLGSYPLATVALVGSRQGDRANSYLLYTWQRSYSSGKWVALSSPAPENVTAHFPSTMKVVSVIDTVSGSPVLYHINGYTVTYPVTDDPVQILFSPLSPSVTHTCG